MPAYAYGILAAGWIAWCTPFFLIKRTTQAPEKVNRNARWGIVFQMVGYSLLWQGHFWTRSLEPWRLALAVPFFVLAGLLSWSGARSLGQQWRIDAGLNADHELVRSGVYRIVRHPIYTSMLCLLLATGFLITPLPLFTVAAILFMIGTEIRVRVEDNLLSSRFGEEFQFYRRSVSAYLPFSR
ncbi:MAG TPA: isoprenylcysteine carboxylmethyltransferase family protein [Terriglobales bacterium]|jgi:protein-S-isoprenylcysteine O-methyltransferase Ste14|nr:isoprenylcysteine carboxylmethyltransferase family protein [Terriglobales bacterium]